jgi:hypothetical protein
MRSKNKTKFAQIPLDELKAMNSNKETNAAGNSVPHIDPTDEVDEIKVEQLESLETQEKEDNKCAAVIKAVARKLLIVSCWPINNKAANKIILFFLISILGWLFVFLVTGASALPGGLYFSLIVLVVAAHSVGYVVELAKMPPLLGMLLVGIFFKNVPVLSIVGKSVDSNTSSILR